MNIWREIAPGARPRRNIVQHFAWFVHVVSAPRNLSLSGFVHAKVTTDRRLSYREPTDVAGAQCSSAGDINNDGIPIWSAATAPNNGAGDSTTESSREGRPDDHHHLRHQSITIEAVSDTATTSSDRLRDFNAGLIGVIDLGVTVDGFGLELTSTLPARASFTNDGTVDRPRTTDFALHIVQARGIRYIHLFGLGASQHRQQRRAAGRQSEMPATSTSLSAARARSAARQRSASKRQPEPAPCG